MSTIFTDIVKNGMLTGASNRTKAFARANVWYRSVTQDQKFADKKLSIKGRTRTNVVPGQMYMFSYDAKTKEQLKYWDAFPLIFPIGPAEGGFYGLNLHYLDPRLRAKLMDGLFTLTNNQKFDDKTKLKISYEILKNSANLRLYQPCLKRYLTSHVKSNFIQIYSSEWEYAALLPVQDFRKAPAETVWKDSARYK